MNQLQLIADYLVENGIEAGEVNWLIRQKHFDGFSIIDLYSSDQRDAAWAAAISWVTGEDFNYLRSFDGKTLHKRYI